jgi:hypothetical protein
MGAGRRCCSPPGPFSTTIRYEKLARRGIEACFVALDGGAHQRGRRGALPESLERMRDKMRGIFDAVASNRSIRRTAIQKFRS